MLDKALNYVFSKDRDFQDFLKTPQAKQVASTLGVRKGLSTWCSGGACQEAYRSVGVHDFRAGGERVILLRFRASARTVLRSARIVTLRPEKELPRYFGISADITENTRA